MHTRIRFQLKDLTCLLGMTHDVETLPRLNRVAPPKAINVGISLIRKQINWHFLLQALNKMRL